MTLAIQDVVRIALEALPGDLIEWAHLDMTALRVHVVHYVGQYALLRGVLLEADEILAELDGELLRRDIVLESTLVSYRELYDRYSLLNVAEPMSKILVVDDHPDITEILSIMFEQLGYEICAAKNGRDAIQLAVEHQPDVAFIDIGLPDLSGYEVVRELRKIFNQTITLVALTGHGQPGDHARSIRAGFDHHILKPPKISVLQRLVDDERRNRS